MLLFKRWGWIFNCFIRLVDQDAIFPEEQGKSVVCRGLSYLGVVWSAGERQWKKQKRRTIFRERKLKKQCKQLSLERESFFFFFFFFLLFIFFSFPFSLFPVSQYGGRREFSPLRSSWKGQSRKSHTISSHFNFYLIIYIYFLIQAAIWSVTINSFNYTLHPFLFTVFFLKILCRKKYFEKAFKLQAAKEFVASSSTALFPSSSCNLLLCKFIKFMLFTFSL